jgi:hypothetical protein
MKNLDELERDVEGARTKLARDLSTLRAPATFSSFTDDLKSDARDTKDALIENAKASARSTVQNIAEDLKAKAAANPAAVLTIGAGLAWRFAHRPPIAATLIGAGLFSLLRTSAVSRPNGGHVDYLTQAKKRLKEQAGDAVDGLKEQASEFANAATTRATEIADAAMESASHWHANVSDAVRQETSHVVQQAASVADQASDVIGGVGENAAAKVRQIAAGAVQFGADQQVRDNFLLGVAGVAVAAALGLGWRRRQDERTSRASTESFRELPL